MATLRRAPAPIGAKKKTVKKIAKKVVKKVAKKRKIEAPKKVSTFEKRIKESNIVFNKLSKAEKRVAIAKDVLKQLDEGVFVAERGIYSRIVDIEQNALYTQDCLIDPLKDLKTSIENKEVICNVCAKGAVFSSLVHFKNEVSIKDGDGITSYEVKKKAKGIFPEKMLDRMETLFEAMNYDEYEYEMEAGEAGLTYYPDKKVKAFAKKYDSADGRMIAIMKNIIRNKGEFTL